MASYYGRRASYVASWAPQRIYPRQEPSFDLPATDATPLDTTQSRQSTQSATLAPHSAPPPMYFPGQAQLARTRAAEAGLPPGLAASTNFASSRTTSLEWAYHPMIRQGWRRFVRADLWWASLRGESEELWSEWPEAFGGRRRSNVGGEDDEEVTAGGGSVRRSISRRSGVSAADSGVALTPRGTMEVQQHPLEALFRARVEELNGLIPGHLRRSRIWLTLLEMINYAWVVMLVVALGVGKGQQTRLLRGVELSLVVIILINGIGVNAVRMRRWALAKELRTRSRDWSPLPITTSTNHGLLNNAGINAGLHFLGEVDRETLAARTRGKDQPTLRWRMRGIEGSWWLSYRPIIKCELVTPSASGLLAYGPDHGPAGDTEDVLGGRRDHVPAYSE